MTTQGQFGRRGEVRPEPPQLSSADAGGPEGPSASPTLTGQLRGVAIGVGIALVLTAVPGLLLKGMGPILERRLDENFTQNTAIDAIAMVKAPSSTLLGIHEACVAHGKEGVSATRGLSEDDAGTLQETAYLECLIATSPERFCQEQDRAHLRRALTNHWRLMTELTQMKRTGFIPTDTSGGSRDGIVGGSPEETSRTRVAASLRSLAEAGYVRLGDFGGPFGVGAPPEARRALDGVHPQSKPCA